MASHPLACMLRELTFAECISSELECYDYMRGKKQFTIWGAFRNILPAYNADVFL